jgi:hypothetical protein
MALLYACSMDHYGTATGTRDTGVVGADDYFRWNVLPTTFLGDAWSASPQIAPAYIIGTSTGSMDIAAPAWGARSGNYALLANQLCYRTAGSGASYNYTEVGSECTRLAIPGTSQTTRLIHLAFSCSALPQLDKQHGRILHLMNDAGDVIMTLAVTPAGRLEMLNFPGAVYGDTLSTAPTVLVSSASPVVEPQKWYFLSISVVTTTDTAGDSTYAVQVYVDGSASGDKVIDAASLTGSANGNVDLLGVLPISISGHSDVLDATVRAVRDIIICDTSGSEANSVLGQAFVSAQGMRAEDAGGGWTAYPREGITQGVLDSHSASTGLRCADAAALEIGSGDFTAETMVRFNALPASGAGRTVHLIAKWRTDTANRSWRLYWNADDTTLVWQVSTDGTATTKVKAMPWTPVVGRWYHVAVARASGATRMFIDGTEVGVDAADSNTYYDGDATLSVAGQFNDTALVADTTLDGWLDETRLTAGVGRYTTDFTAPTSKFGRNSTDDTSFTSVQLLLGYDTTTVADESSAARTVTTTLSGTTPDDATYSYQVLNQRPAWDDSYVEAPNTYAEGTFTFTGLPSDGETMTVGSITYTWKTTLTGSADEVLIGASTAACITNIIAAINAGSGAGTLYGTGTTANTDASALTYLDPQFQLRALSIGTDGNSVATTETMASGAFKAATLTGGLDIPADSQFAIERLPTDITGVVAVQVTARAYKSDAGSASIQWDLIGPAGGVQGGTAASPDLNAAWMRQIFDTDPDTSAGITPSTLTGGRIRFKRV